MGNTCGCADNVSPSTEMSMEQDDILRRMQGEGSKLDDETLKLLLQNVHLIVRM